MKKLLFFILLSGIAFKLKAQQKPSIKPLGKLTGQHYLSSFDTIPKLSIKPKNDLNALFLPKGNLYANKLVAFLDRMPIVKPVGKWNMPVVHPDGTVVYTMPVKRLPLIIQPDPSAQKLHP